MIRKLTILTVLYLFSFSNFATAYEYLRVLDPQGWHSSQGTIEEAVVSIKPKGVYMEVGLYLTFSARGWYYNANDTLEVEFRFDLPENAIVFDSWLWVGEDIVRAEIMDKWTASEIYEDIVRRRRDPSILFKRGNNNYELRIYPMAASDTRKVKLSYLVPTQWGATSVQAPLPTNILKASRFAIPEFNVLTWLNEKWKNPKIPEFPEINFSSLSDTIFGEYLQADIPSEAIQNSLNFALDSPLNEGVYVNSFEYGNSGIYQLAFLPSQALNLASSSKVAVLVDYDVSNCSVSGSDVLNNVKYALHTTLAPTDSFNLVISQLSINRVSEQWLPADSATIEETFSSLGADPISNYSNLPSLLANGIEFINENGTNGSILLLSSSDQVGNYTIANQLIDDLIDLMQVEIPIHVADFQNQNYTYNYIGSQYYYGNEYFYTNICRLTSGNFYNIRTGYSFPDLVSSAFSSLSGFLSSFDLYTRLESGYCYSRYNLDNQNSQTHLNRPILQVGKYQGSLPFIIEASGTFESEVFTQKFTIDETDAEPADSLSVEAWTGNYIQYMESQLQTNDVVNEIIDFSIDERVLSIYSAFICLEPEQGGQICYDCMDESGVVGIEEVNDPNKSDSVFVAYPNPFNNRVKIEFALPQNVVASETTFKIYSILGQVVRTFSASSNFIDNKYQFIWNGKNNNGADVSSGTYFFVVNTGHKQYSLKLLFMK